ncbi:MAG: type I-E CRISPR-associated protein Cas5/CasD [Dehalococcoidia bacterium]|nr:type I-E CRISPR-associated protein Cas5/CasD [Dehalococcoidia bacterium]
MSTLLLRLCGPMQAWGTRSRFTERDTELEPSKSGVAGLLCAAIGRTRDLPVDDIAALKMGVRVDHEGTMARDYHTAGGGGSGVVRASGGTSRDAVLSNRYYLADADFLVGLEGNRGFLEELDAALRVPEWQLSLGRKSFVPALPVYLPGGGIRDDGLEAALKAEPWPLGPASMTRRYLRENPSRRLRIVLEASFDDDNVQVRQDQPAGVCFATRSFGPRAIRQDYFEHEEPSHVPQPAHA